MRWNKDTKDAIISSVLVGLAYGAFWGSITYIAPTANAHPWKAAFIAATLGVIVGLITTLDVEE